MVIQGGPRHRWSSAAARRLCMRAGGAPDVPTAVVRLGEELLRGISCPPTDLEQIARRLAVSQITSRDIGGSGELHKIDDKFMIVTAEELPAARRRFTIAHELGHILTESIGAHAPDAGRELERLCDLIATELLMPTDRFREHLPETLTLSDIWRMSREFGVSFLAAAYRCVELARVSTIEITHHRLVRARGQLKIRSLRELDASLQDIINNATGSGEAVLYLNHDHRIREWRVEYQSRGPNCTFFLLYPLAQRPATA
jgi:Zn-dependent peptidase ImmA (M78 family)